MNTAVLIVLYDSDQLFITDSVVQVDTAAALS